MKIALKLMLAGLPAARHFCGYGDPGMIARIWRGAVRAEDAPAYAEYVQQTGIEAYQHTPGNRGAWLPVADRRRPCRVHHDELVGVPGRD